MLIISRAKLFTLLFFLTQVTWARVIDLSFRANVLTGAELINLKENSNINPDNQIFKQFNKSLHLELRPNLELRRSDWAQLTLRPRFEGLWGTSPRGNKTETLLKRDLWLNEGFLTLTPKDFVQFNIGRQNYLWGPSEAVGPSNPFYSDILNRPSPLFLLRGVNMARINISSGTEYSFVSMVETNSMEDADFQIRYPEKEENKHRMILKAEYTSQDGQISAGVTGGKKSQNPYSKFIGSYFMWTINSAFQSYADARVDETNSTHSPYWVMGLRFTFQDGIEWRNEYIYKKAASIELTPIVQDNLFYDKYYYSSLRKNFGSWKLFQNPIWGARSLYSLSNHSGILSSFGEAGLNDFTTLTVYIAQTYGPTQTDYNRLFHTLGGIYLTMSY